VGDVEARPLLLELLDDEAQHLREFAAHELREETTNAFSRENQIKLSKLVIDACGDNPLAERVATFVAAPRPMNLAEEVEFSEFLLKWLCVRLLYASPNGRLYQGRLYGEFAGEPSSLLEPGARVLMRVSMDTAALPRERNFHPTHNLLEAWRVARHLRAENPPSFFLVCADVPFAALEARLPALKPGQVLLKPTIFGFRIPQGRAAPSGDSALLLAVSTQAAALWESATAQERARYTELLASLADRPHVDMWALLPLLSQVGEQLPPGLRAALGRRLPSSSSEAAYLRLKAARALGVEIPAEVPPEVAADEPPQVALQRVLAPARQVLEAEIPIQPGIEALLQALSLLGRGIPGRDLDDVVYLLDRLRDRASGREQAQQLLELVERLQPLELPPVARRRLEDVRNLLELALSSRRWHS
jgi:hypothetical protein